MGCLWRVAPGLTLCLGVTGLAIVIERLEAEVFGRAWLESLVLAILIGTLIRTAWRPGRRFQGGIHLCGKTLLDIAVVLLGASVSVAAVAAAGPRLFGMVAGIVVVAIAGSYGMGRLLGLPHRIATLIACGNSICGNSAIAAVAPVIGADGQDVATSIAFTAVLGVGVVLALPLSMGVLHLSAVRYGALAGLTAYAVPQVIAATAPAGVLAVQLGTLVKLMRVLMLGPVVLLLGAVSPNALADRVTGPNTLGRRLAGLMPWFIPGFLALAVARTLGAVPPMLLAPIGHLAGLFTIMSMAALGLGTDLRAVAQAGARAIAAVSFSLLFLGAISLGLIQLSGLV